MKKFLALLLSVMLVASMAVAMIPASASEVNVALGAPAACGDNCTASEYGPVSTVVTDGTLPAEGTHWETCYLIKPVDTTQYAWLDIGEFAATDVTSIKFTFIKTSESGFNPPYEPVVQFWVNGAWSNQIGFSESPANAADLADGVHTYTETLETPVNTTKIRIGFFAWAWICVGEVEVYGTPAEGSTTPGTPSEDPVVPSNKNNLVLNKEPVLMNNTQVSEYAGAASVITDGVICGSGWSCAAIDRLDKSEGVDALAGVQFALDGDAEISEVVIHISPDDGLRGDTYEPQLRVKNAEGEFEHVTWIATKTEGTPTYTYSVVFNTPVTASEIQVAWYGFGWVAVDEIQVFGDYVDNGSDDNTTSEAPVVSDDDNTTSEAPVVSDDDNTTSEAPSTSTPSTSTPSTSTPSSSKPSTPATGDASGMMVFAVIALVAIAGSAVVIKTRR